LKKRTSINSIPKIHKEKEMADFRKWLFALAAVALLAGLSVPASAQQNALTCTVQTATDNLVRAEGLAEQVGDVVLSCTGGTPTALGQPVPAINIQLFMNYNVTSKITGTQASGGINTTVFDEALLIIDEPNSPTNPTIPLLVCDTNAVIAGICSITGTGTGVGTYNGAPATLTTPSRPNVFQGRIPVVGTNLFYTSVVFNNVPFDPPGSNNTRILRFTNVRVDANQTGAAQSNFQVPITMGIGSSGSATVPISFQALVVATAQLGLTSKVTAKSLSFAQCNAWDPGLKASSSYPPSTGVDAALTFIEGFSNAWKVRNLSVAQANGSFATGQWLVGGPATIINTDLNQNVPGVNYFTESGFESLSSTLNPSPNPPTGLQTFGSTPTTTVSGGVGFGGTQSSITNVALAGQASQGTRLAIALQSIPNGLTLWVQEVVSIQRQATGQTSGVMVLVATDGVTGANVSAQTTSAATTANLFAITGPAALITYEVLYSDPYSNEYATVPFYVSYSPNLSANAPIGLPQPNIPATAAGGFAPFYLAGPPAFYASQALPVPRFVFLGTAANIVEVLKCSCNLLFPYVTQAAGYDTGIAIANTTADPGWLTGQSGSVTFYYYNGTGIPPAPPYQCTNTVSPGTCPSPTTGHSVLIPGDVLTYTLFNGSSTWGLDNRAVGFTGYIITEAQFQYCHGFAFIGGLGGGPAVNSQTNGLSEGYLALVLDSPLPSRTPYSSESLGQ
jgi:hypothetical protein